MTGLTSHVDRVIEKYESEIKKRNLSEDEVSEAVDSIDGEMMTFSLLNKERVLMKLLFRLLSHF